MHMPSVPHMKCTVTSNKLTTLLTLDIPLYFTYIQQQDVLQKHLTSVNTPYKLVLSVHAISTLYELHILVHTPS